VSPGPDYRDLKLAIEGGADSLGPNVDREPPIPTRFFERRVWIGDVEIQG
jgi:hypothetical protein